MKIFAKYNILYILSLKDNISYIIISMHFKFLITSVSIVRRKYPIRINRRYNEILDNV